MEHLFINGSDAERLGIGQREGFLKLLAQHANLEVMQQSIQKNSFIWLTPAEQPETMEFFYVLSGHIQLMLADGPVDVVSGNSFYVDGLEHEIALKAVTACELLYISSQPVFDELFAYQADLQTLLRQIDEKDHITYHHSTHVVDICEKVLTFFPADAVTRDILLPAAMFHDVGKCFLPDEILKKPDKLEQSEARYIVKHPMYSGRLLRPCLGEAVAAIARNHHERLDGSGYPMGLTAGELSLEDRILAAVDTFEAMTAYRRYNTPLEPVAAAKELTTLHEQFDLRVTRILLELAKTGAFTVGKDMTNE